MSSRVLRITHKQRPKTPRLPGPKTHRTGAEARRALELQALQGFHGLAERMALHQTTASNLVNALVEGRLIRRVRDDTDQRVVHLHLSAEGKQMLLRTPGPHAGLLVDGLRRLDADELARLREALRVLVAIMRRTAATAAGEPLLGE